MVKLGLNIDDVAPAEPMETEIPPLETAPAAAAASSMEEVD